jgi:hypothetical protein
MRIPTKIETQWDIPTIDTKQRLVPVTWLEVGDGLNLNSSENNVHNAQLRRRSGGRTA